MKVDRAEWEKFAKRIPRGVPERDKRAMVLERVVQSRIDRGMVSSILPKKKKFTEARQRPLERTKGPARSLAQRIVPTATLHSIMESSEAHHLYQARMLNYAPPPHRPATIVAPIKYKVMTCSGNATFSIPVDYTAIICPCPDQRTDSVFSDATTPVRKPPLCYWLVYTGTGSTNNVAGARSAYWLTEANQLDTFAAEVANGAILSGAWDYMTRTVDFTSLAGGATGSLPLNYPGTLSSLDPIDMIQGAGASDVVIFPIAAGATPVSSENGSYLFQSGSGKISLTASVPYTGSGVICSVGPANHPQQYGIQRLSTNYDQVLTANYSGTLTFTPDTRQIATFIADNTPDTVPTFYATPFLNQSVAQTIASIGNVQTMTGSSGTSTYTTEFPVTAKSRGFIAAASLGAMAAYNRLWGAADATGAISNDFCLVNGMLPPANTSAMILSGHGFVVVQNTSSADTITCRLNYEQDYYVQAPPGTAYYEEATLAKPGILNPAQNFPGAPVIAPGAVINKTPAQKAIAHATSYSTNDEVAKSASRVLSNALEVVAPTIHAVSPSLTRLADRPESLPPKESAPLPTVSSTSAPSEVVHAIGGIPNELLSKASSIAKSLPGPLGTVAGAVMNGVGDVEHVVSDIAGPISSILGDIF